MRHDSSIPVEFHSGLRDDIRDALGSFWSSVFADRELLDADLEYRVMSAAQLYVNVMEALSVRDHNGMPVFHREHWHPVIIRLSQRNTGSGLRIKMEDTTVIGKQTQAKNPNHVYMDDEIFVIGGNAEYSKVNTYPMAVADGCRLVKVGTCLCDSISRPKHILVQDRDFSIRDEVLFVRKEHDPFSAGGYRTEPDGDDTVAVLWACDAYLDTNNVGDFLGYPLGIDAETSEAAAEMLSSLWDVVTYGVTPQGMNRVLGAIFDIPVLKSDSSVESVTADQSSGSSTVVTQDRVYVIPTQILADCVVAGASLPAGTMLTNEIKTYQGLSKVEVEALIDAETNPITNLALPPGSVAGVSENVVIENIESKMQQGGWFMLNSSDSRSSPFWTAVMSRTTEDERTRVFNRLVTGTLADGTPVVNPLRALGYTALANLILVVTGKPMRSDRCAMLTLDTLMRMVPSASGLMIVQFDRTEEDAVTSSDEATVVNGVSEQLENAAMASDDVTFTFVPDAATEV